MSLWLAIIGFCGLLIVGLIFWLVFVERKNAQEELLNKELSSERDHAKIAKDVLSTHSTDDSDIVYRD